MRLDKEGVRLTAPTRWPGLGTSDTKLVSLLVIRSTLTTESRGNILRRNITPHPRYTLPSSALSSESMIRPLLVSHVENPARSLR